MSSLFNLGSEMEFAAIVPFEQGTEEWLQWRDSGIGASEVAAVVGESPWISLLELWAKKTGVIKSYFSVGEVEDLRWRSRMEPAILDEYLSRHPECKLIARSPCFQRTDFGFIRASLDAITGDSFGSINTEIKTANFEDDWIDKDGEPTIPPHYMCQALWQMMATGIKRTRFAVLINGFSKKYIEREIEYDDHAAQVLFNAASFFWTGVEANTPPPPDLNNTDGDKRAIGAIFDKVDESQICTISNEFYVNLTRRAALNEQLEHIQNEIATIENGIKMLGGNAKIVQTEDGRKLCSKSIIEKVTINAEDLKRENPALYIKLKKETRYPRWTFAR